MPFHHYLTIGASRTSNVRIIKPQRCAALSCQIYTFFGENIKNQIPITGSPDARNINSNL